MNRKRNLTALLVGSVVTLAGLAFSGPAVAESPSSDRMDAMHGSSAMVQMHQRMSSGAQANCDRMHEQMDGWMQRHVDQMPSEVGGMMEGSGGMMSY